MRNHTFFRYFIPYALILSIALAGFYVVIDIRLKTEFSDTYAAQNEINTQNLGVVLERKLAVINQVATRVHSNIEILMWRYSDSRQAYTATTELNKHISFDPLIRDIIVIDHESLQAVSTSTVVTVEEGSASLRLMPGNVVMPMASEEMQAVTSGARLIRQGADRSAVLVYVPTQHSQRYSVLFILNMYELREVIAVSMSQNLADAWLLDEAGQPIVQVGAASPPDFAGLIAASGPEVTRSADGAAVYYTVATGLPIPWIVVLEDSTIIADTINRAFSGSYVIMGIILLALAAIAFFALRITYLPLHRMAQKIGRGYRRDSDELQSIEAAFLLIENERRELLERIRQDQDLVHQRIDTDPAYEARPYPRALMERLEIDLSEADIDAMGGTIQALLHTIADADAPEVYVHCVLIDMMQHIISAMIRMNVRLDQVDSLYGETMKLCGQHDHVRHWDAIVTNISRLTGVLVDETDKGIHIQHIWRYIEEHCYDSEFSVARLSEHFGVSVPYMSYFFKKKTSQNLSDSIWRLRLKKAQHLLSATGLPIDQVSAAIGYDNPSSFRRKFKEAMGVTPSQYRKNMQGSGEAD